MKGKAKHFRYLVWLILVQPWVAEAHPFHWPAETLGFFGGLFHPFTGTDHLLTMLPVGLWAAGIGKRWAYWLPFGFIASMLAGCGLSLMLIEIPHAEAIMLLSVSMLALLLITEDKVSPLLGSLAVMVTALLHGYTHGYDIWLEADAAAYTTGFSAATLILIGMGIGARVLFGRLALNAFHGRQAERLY